MKRKRLFLGLTTAFLAIVGVAASKSRFALTGWYTTAGHDHTCVSTSFSVCPNTGSNFQCKTSGSSGQFVYTAGDCQNVLRYNN